MASEGSVTRWLGLVQAGNAAAAQQLWERYFERLIRLARDKIRRSRAAGAIEDEEDAALSAFDSFCDGAVNGRYPLLHDREVMAVAFSPDGDTIFTGSVDQTARLWTVPAPVAGKPERIRLWAEVITGKELDEAGDVHALEPSNWQQRLLLLEESGGAPTSGTSPRRGKNPGIGLGD